MQNVYAHVKFSSDYPSNSFFSAANGRRRGRENALNDGLTFAVISESSGPADTDFANCSGDKSYSFIRSVSTPSSTRLNDCFFWYLFFIGRSITCPSFSKSSV